jgi:hypothetical protein
MYPVWLLIGSKTDPIAHILTSHDKTRTGIDLPRNKLKRNAGYAGIMNRSPKFSFF